MNKELPPDFPLAASATKSHNYQHYILASLENKEIKGAMTEVPELRMTTKNSLFLQIPTVFDNPHRRMRFQRQRTSILNFRTPSMSSYPKCPTIEYSLHRQLLRTKTVQIRG